MEHPNLYQRHLFADKVDVNLYMLRVTMMNMLSRHAHSTDVVKGLSSPKTRAHGAPVAANEASKTQPQYVRQHDTQSLRSNERLWFDVWKTKPPDCR